MGLALSPACSGEDLIRFADAALRVAKRGGRGRVVVFDPVLAKEVEHRCALALDLRTALAEGDLRLHYQPVVELSTGRVVGLEALARWWHPTLGQIAPTQFVPVAEQSGMAAVLDTWAVRRASSDLADLRRRQLMTDGVWVAVNLSARSPATARWPTCATCRSPA